VNRYRPERDTHIHISLLSFPPYLTIQHQRLEGGQTPPLGAEAFQQRVGGEKGRFKLHYLWSRRRKILRNGSTDRNVAQGEDEGLVAVHLQLFDDAHVFGDEVGFGHYPMER
jgi:hypothetical protein